MNKFFLHSLLLGAVLLHFHTVDAIVKKPWTFLVYMAAANDLNPLVLSDLQEMMKVGSQDNVNILVYLTIQEDDQPKQTKKLYVNCGSVKQIGETMVRDSGAASTLLEALQWAHGDYPSDHIAVVLWGHGTGALNRSPRLGRNSRGVCYDFDTDNYLTDRDCLRAFLWARDNLREGKKIDILAFDGCLLASFELAYTFASCVDYMVASQDALPGDGYRYASIVQQLATYSTDPFLLVQCMVNNYDQDDLGLSRYAVSAVDLNCLQPLVDNCNAVAQVLTSQLKGINHTAVKATIKKCIHAGICPSFDQNGIYIDMCQFYKNLLHNIDDLKLPQSIVTQFNKLLADGITMFSTIIKAYAASDNYAQIRGLSIYFSRYSLDFSYYGLYWTEKNPNWLDFLEAYLNVSIG